MSRLVVALVFVFAVVLTASHAQTYSVLYSFGSVAGDGIDPTGTLILGPTGDIYGTTQVGGQNGVGTVFKLTATGTETVLCSAPLRTGHLGPCLK